MKNLSIKIKLFLILIFSLIFLSTILGVISIKETENTLIAQKYKALTSTRDSKVRQLQELFKLYTKQVKLLSDTPFVKNLTVEFEKLHKEIGYDKFENFPIDNKKIKQALPKWDTFYKDYTNTYPFNDVLVISNEGHVFYTYKKLSDYGQNLETGTLADSPLAKVWGKVKNTRKIVYSDIEKYAPNDYGPAMFLAAPIYIKGEFKSVVVLKLKLSSIEDIMNFRAGYANTHEDYLVGKDYLMRSNSFLASNTHSLEASLKNPEVGFINTLPVKEAFKGFSNTKTNIDFRGKEVLSSYTLFNINKNLSWAVISQVDLDEVLKTPNGLKRTLIFISLITLIVVTLILYFVIQKYIINSLNTFQEGLLTFFKFLNRESNEVELLKIDSKDEIGLMSKAVNKGIIRTQENINKIEIETWIKDGVNQLNQILINLKDLKDVTDESINFISNYVNAGVAVLYIYNEKEKKLKEYSSFAHVKRDELSSEFKLKEGIIGQVAFQKKPILLTNIKKDESLITTGTTTQKSFNTYTFPLIYNKDIFGVIEIGSFSTFDKKILDFFDNINKTICIAISSAIKNKKVKELLEETKEANAQLEINQIKLEEANANMEEQQQQLEEANANLEEQQQQLEEANANMEEQQQQLKISEQNLKEQNRLLEETKKEIEQKAKELEQSGKYKSEFLANMSHELRTPLNSIILLSSLLQKNSKKTLTEDDIKKAKTIFESGNELLRLINDILDLSKVESGKMELIVDKFNSIDLLKQMKEIFNYAAIEKGIKFEIEDNYNAPIYNDKDRISQIIRNLVSNSLKFTKKGSITLSISASKNLTKDFCISVQDTGIGIPKNKQELIFKAFTQADGSTSRQYGGTGLGLSISKELSKLLGGYISLESKENKGSKFSIDLPNLNKNDVQHIEKEIVKPEQKSTFTTKPSLSLEEQEQIVIDDRKLLDKNKEAFLIIDDDEVFSSIVYEEIKKSGNYGLIALNATTGLELIKKYNIKGIMLDLTLPDMDGIEVLRELKSKQATKNIPVHVISSKDKNNETLKLGAIGYLQKPVLDGDINNVINSIENINKKEIKDLLIVEDNDIQKEALIELIGTNDINITAVNSAQDAINKLKTESFDTVVVDLSLMDGTGQEVCEFIKNKYPKLPIIIYTAKDLTKEEKIKLQEYSNSIIVKTANSNERILSEINLFLHREEDIKETKEIFKEVDLSDKKILIVDDDIKNIFVLDAALKEFNATTFTAFNGQEALDFLDKNSVDLILMDIMMPVMDGYEAMERIRNNEKMKNIPIIAVTAKAMKDDREKCIKLGADDYLSKPIDINILANLIKLWSNKKHK
ncbi:histidine kinase [Malaciobacter molluscorum]|uniref:response regulator n=1 Tax=Malaciobacter molluscorum TaxID=1032072 RepID=UPI00100B70BE|nr:response regulator [Malaciobacter molluscorum]RXJ93562.1 histidine kinase [Malaciobacter molluscorum]